jgi:hypothetical protein
MSATNFREYANFIWGVADLIRDSFKRGKYQDVILPLTVLRRIDCVLESTKAKVFEVNKRLTGRLENRDPQLRKASGFAFYNTSRYDFDRLLADAPGLVANLNNYINGFSENMREVLEKFNFRDTIRKLDEAGLLFKVVERFRTIDLHPGKVSNHEMGLIFEELIRRFNEALDENPGEHFTPREVIRLMVNLLLSRDREALARNQEDLVRTVFSLPSTPFNDREKFLAALDSATKSAGIKLSAPLRKAALSALSERDEAAEICRDDEGNPEPDPDLRDTENVPLGESVQAFFDREVKPHVPDAWINRAILDHKDGRVGKVGYEINFNRYFYKYQPPRPLEEIESDIKTIEKDILAMLRDAAG